MTQPEGGFTPRKSEAELHTEAADARAKRSPWDFSAADPQDLTQRYSDKSSEVYERKVAADGEGYRAGLVPSDVRYQGMPHEQLVGVVNDGVSADDVDEKGTLVNDVGNALKEMSTTFRQAVTKEQAGWQGTGADAAFTYVGNVATWADSAGDAAYLTSNRFSQTSAAIASAQRNMPPPAGRSVTQSMQLANQQMTSGNFLDGIATLKDAPAQAAIQYAAQQEAARVVTSRDQTLYSAGSTQPVYAAPPPPTNPAPASLGSVATAVAGPAAAPVHVRSTGAAVSQPAVTQPPVSQPPVSQPAVSEPDATHTASATSPVGPSVPAVVPGTSVAPGGPVGVPDQPERGGVSGVGSPGNPVSNPSAGAGDTSARLPGSALGAGIAAGLVAGGVGGGVGAGAGDGERAGFGRGAANRSAARPVGGAPAEGESGGSAGRRVTTSEPGARAAAERAQTLIGKEGKAGANAMPSAAGRGKSDEDKEHKRPDYLVENDPEDALGLEIATDEHGNKIAPPVIGD